MARAGLAAGHRLRRREVWLSAGWPCRDPIELDLLAGGLLRRRWDYQGRARLAVEDGSTQWVMAMPVARLAKGQLLSPWPACEAKKHKGPEEGLC